MAGVARSLIIRNLQHARKFSTNITRHASEKAPIKVFGVEGRYAHAMFSAASKSDALNTTEVELNEIEAMLNAEEKLAEYCYDPTINKLQKRDVIAEILQVKNFSELTVNFMSVIAEGNRFKRIPGIVSAFGKIMRARRGEVDCTITTARPLETAMYEELTATLEKFIKPTENLKIDTNLDPELIGGMVINLGEYFIDMSTATKIKRISRAIKGAD